MKNQFVDNIKVDNGTIPVVAGIIGEDLYSTIPINSIEKITKKIIIEDEIKAPIKHGDILGKVEYYLGDNYLGAANIISTYDIDELPSPSLIERILNKWYLILIFGYILLRLFIIFNKKKRRRRHSYYDTSSLYY